jgi:hypothetical protein
LNLCHCVVNRVRDRQAGPTLRRNRVPLAHQCDDHGIEPVVNARSRHWSARRGLAVGIRAPPAPTGLRILVIGRIKNEAAAAGVQKAWAEPSSPWREAERLRRRADLQIPSGRALQQSGLQADARRRRRGKGLLGILSHYMAAAVDRRVPSKRVRQIDRPLRRRQHGAADITRSPTQHVDQGSAVKGQRHPPGADRDCRTGMRFD